MGAQTPIYGRLRRPYMAVSLAEEEEEARVLMADAMAMRAKYEAAFAKARADAVKMLPARKELQTAVNEAAWARSRVAARLSEAEELKRKSFARYSSISATYAEATAVRSSFTAILDAVDPTKVREVLRGVGTGTVSCIAAATSPLAGTALIGADVGRMVSETVKPLLSTAKAAVAAQLTAVPLPDAAAGPLTKWADASFGAVCTGTGIWVAYKTRTLVLLCSGALIGAKMVTQSVSAQLEGKFGTSLDQLSLAGTMGLGLDMLDGKADGATIGGLQTASLPLDAKSITEVALAVLAIGCQLTFGAEMPTMGKVALGPLLALEAFLKAKAVVAAVPSS